MVGVVGEGLQMFYLGMGAAGGGVALKYFFCKRGGL